MDAKIINYKNQKIMLVDYEGAKTEEDYLGVLRKAISLN